MTQQMQKSLPPSMRKYAGAYLQQHMMSNGGATNPGTSFSQPAATPHSPVPFGPGQEHFHPPGEQHPWQPVHQSHLDQLAAPGATVAPATPQPAPEQPAPAAQPFDFIINSDQTPKRPLLPSLPSGSSTLMRALLFGGGLVVLLIAFVIVKSLLSGTPALTPFVSLIQDQQEMIHLTTEAGQQQGISNTTQNFAITAQLSLSTSQVAINQYLIASHFKLNPNLINLKVSSATDAQLTAAAANSSYDETFQQIMQAKLTIYVGDLQETFKHTSGPDGQALLKTDYQQAQLLLNQLKTPAS